MRRSEIAQQILLAVAGLSVAAASTACSSPQSSSSAGAGSAAQGGGVETSDDPPWEDEIKDADPNLAMLVRACWPKETIWKGPPSAPGAEPSGSATPAVTPTSACPTIADLGTLGYTHPSKPTDMAGSVVTKGPVEWEAKCCYLESHWHTGRPLMVDGQAVAAPAAARADWSSALPGRAGVDRAHAEAWLRDARLEHASIASFARFAEDLLALGAPSALVAEAHRAALDEIDHAKRAFAIAARLGGAHVGPGALREAALPRAAPELTAVVDAAIREGCVAETMAAMLAEAELDECGRGAAPRAGADVIEALAVIARDEARHATLAFAFVAWALEQDRAGVAPIVASAIRGLGLPFAGDAPTDPRLPPTAMKRVAEEARETAARALESLLSPPMG